MVQSDSLAKRENVLLYQSRELAGVFHRLFWCLPAFATLIFLIFVTVRVVAWDGEIKDRYRVGLKSALGAENFELARAYGERLILWPGDMITADRMDWVTSLLGNKEIGLAFEQLNQLAPEGSAGYPRAHRLKAIMYTQRFESTGPA